MLRRLRRHVTYANVTATIALVAALGGTSYAAVMVTGRQVRDGSLTGADIRNKSVTGRDVRDRSISGADVRDRSLSGSDLKPGSIPANRLRNPLSGQSGTPSTVRQGASGPAGGDLTGSYPNPVLAAGAVGSVEVADGSIAPGDLRAVPNVRVTRNTPQSVGSSQTSTVSFDAEVSDAFAMHADTDSSRIVIPLAGTYVVAAGVRMSNNPASGRRFASIQLNDAAEIASDTRTTVNATDAAHLVSMSTVRRLSAGDYLELRVSQTSGFVQTVSPGEQTHLAAAWVGP